jgi:hypothetical protein
MIVTTPAVTPVHEALESARQLATEFSIALAPVAVNMVDDAPPPLDDASSLPTHLRDAWQWSSARATSQASAVAELDAALSSHLHIARVLLRRHRLDGADLVAAMADDLPAAIEQLPEVGAR